MERPQVLYMHTSTHMQSGGTHAHTATHTWASDERALGTLRIVAASLPTAVVCGDAVCQCLGSAVSGDPLHTLHSGSPLATSPKSCCKERACLYGLLF